MIHNIPFYLFQALWIFFFFTSLGETEALWPFPIKIRSRAEYELYKQTKKAT